MFHEKIFAGGYLCRVGNRTVMAVDGASPRDVDRTPVCGFRRFTRRGYRGIPCARLERIKTCMNDGRYSECVAGSNESSSLAATASSPSPAAGPLRFYAKNGNAAAGCDFVLLVDDVCGYDQGPFVHPSPKVIKPPLTAANAFAMPSACCSTRSASSAMAAAVTIAKVRVGSPSSVADSSGLEAA